MIRWDGVKQDFDGWNQDQTLRSSMRHSTVWVYQQFAREIGEVREKEYLTRIRYGNADRPEVSIASGSTAPLRISAMERWISCENCIETSFRSRSSISVWSRIS